MLSRFARVPERAQALEIADDLGVLAEQARAHEGIGRCLLHDGLLREAAAALRKALGIYRQISSPGAQRVETTLLDNKLLDNKLLDNKLLDNKLLDNHLS